MPAPRKYPDELRDRAVKMVQAVRRNHGQLNRVARQLGVPSETLRNWVQQVEPSDATTSPATPSDDKRRITELERELRELRRTNRLLKAASAYFARELSPKSRHH